MAPRAFLLTLAFVVVLLITSEVAAARQLAENTNSEINDSGRGGHIIGGGLGEHHKSGNYGGHDKGCRRGCCGGRDPYSRGGCKCCSTFEEATAYKQTKN
ncbi:unnamed protein product [Lactuca virosa]|uniref:Glycine-rich protein n=1 Tax=Lactuca virosa TaxID=75947 RepID=A0AAU9PJL3_9ASTR|nr:unnamed protein product [Lactuca virosa]